MDSPGVVNRVRVFRLTAAFGVALALLSGCGLVEVERAEREAGETARRMQDRLPAVPERPLYGALSFSEGPWLSIAVPERPAGDPLPGDLLEEDAVTLPLAGDEADGVLARRVEDVAAVAVELVGAGVEAAAVRVAADGMTGSGGVWTGPLDRLLDRWAAARGYVWRYDAAAQTVRVVRSLSRTFRVNALSGKQEWRVSTSTAGGGSGDGSSARNEQSISAGLDYEPWSEIEAQLEEAAGGEASVLLSKIGAAVAVKGLPRAVDRVRARLEHLNRTILRPVTLGFHVFRVSFARDARYNVGLGGTLHQILGTSATVSLDNGAIRVSRRTERGPRAKNSLSATVDALHEVGTTSRVLSVEVPSLNGRPAQFYRLQDKAYLKQIRTVRDEGGGTSQEYVPGTVSWGISIGYLAQIVAPDEVLARLSVNISDQPVLEEFPKGSASPGQLRIQLPQDQSRRAISSTQAIRHGETLVLTGFADRFSTGGRSSPLGAGAAPFPWGGLSGGSDRWEQVLLVTAEIGRPLGISDAPVREIAGAAEGVSG